MRLAVRAEIARADPEKPILPAPIAYRVTGNNQVKIPGLPAGRPESAIERPGMRPFQIAAKRSLLMRG
jgi:hypothetical protein